ncbi:MAG: class I SAM-dependent methyltransferase [Anaerolineales bacterium]
MGLTSFDERAKDWDADPAKVERAQVVAQAIRAALPPQPGKSALEVGCGTGLLSFFLQKDFAHITLADSSEGMLEVLRAKIAAARAKNLTALRLDLSADPLPEARFDVIYSLMVLHHLPDTAKSLSQFHALLNPGGWLVICDLDAEDGSFHPAGTSGIHFGFTRPALQKQVESAAFNTIKFSTPYVLQKAGKSYPLFLLTAQK